MAGKPNTAISSIRGMASSKLFGGVMAMPMMRA